MTQVAIQLPDELSEFVKQSVQAGDFHTADEFFISVVSMYKDRVEERLSGADQAKLDSRRRDIQVGGESARPWRRHRNRLGCQDGQAAPRTRRKTSEPCLRSSFHRLRMEAFSPFAER